jgi:hypothetical protein
MPLFAAFCGGSHAERSPAIDAEQCVNLFPVTVKAAGAAKAKYLLGTPGLRPLGVLPTSPGRGEFTQDGRTWAVGGDTLYELTLDPVTSAVTVATARGTMLNDGRPVSWASNGDGGSQLAISGGGQLKVLNLVTNVLSAAIVLPLTNPAGRIGFIDGYVILHERNTLRFWFCAIENVLLWDALDFVTRSTASDHIVTLVCANSRVWIFGSQTSEAYEDVGDADNPFAPIKGSLFEIGCGAEWSVSIGVATVRWVGQSDRSSAGVYRLDGYNGTRISSDAEDARLATARTLSDAEALTYEQDGHLFYALSCPSLGDGGTTLCVDEAEQAWHDRSAWNAALGREDMWRVRGHVCLGTQHVVGSRDSGSIWGLELTTYDDDGAILRARRRAPYLGAENAYAVIDRFELGVEPGVGLASGQGSDPRWELRVSKDLAKTWWSKGTSRLGAMGQYGVRLFWTRLGQVRVDRLVLEVVITDPVKRVIGPGAWIHATPGKAAA